MSNKTTHNQPRSLGSLMVHKAFKYGFMATVLMIVGLLIFYFASDNTIRNIRSLSLVIGIIFVFFSVKEFRNAHNNTLMFWQGIFVSLGCFLFFAMGSGLILYFYTKHIDPQSLTAYMEYKLSSLEAYRERLGEERYADYYEKTQALGPMGVTMDHLFTLFYISLFTSGLIAAVLRKSSGADS